MWKIPAETALHRRTWLAWPWAANIWNKIHGTSLKLCQDNIDRLIRAIANYEDVSILARNCDILKLEKRFRRNTVDRYSIEVVPAKYNDIWVRDTFPTFAVEAESLIALSWNFNGWGQRVKRFSSFGDDAKLCSKIAEMIGATLVDSGIVGEGGAFAFDDDDVVFTTKSVLLDRRRNPKLEKSELENRIKLITGRKKICWLPGDRGEPISSGHVDSLVAFANDKVLMNWIHDESCPEFDICDYNSLRLKSWLAEQGIEKEIVKIPSSTQVRSADHCGSYINFACVNGGLIIPKFGRVNEDDFARRTITEAMNNKMEVEMLDVSAIAIAGGGIHCVTKQEPCLV